MESGRAIVSFGRKSLPPGFVFGLASSAYQYEGAVNEHGRGVSIWDTFSHTPGKIYDDSNGDVAQDQYHRYKEDIKLLVDLGVDSYRFSIAWPRIFPEGRGTVNKEGLAYYHDLIKELLDNGIEPMVTLFHWDLPQPLQDEYGGFLSDKIVEDFKIFADTCFEAFGDRVKKWTTINETFSIAYFGYDKGTHAPGRSTKSGGDSAREPYIVAHNMLLSHATVVQLYREKYQKTQKGSISIVLFSNWFIPYTHDSPDDEAARLRILDFYLGWFMDPLTNGEYPRTMRENVGDRLPQFSPKQSELVKGSFDFVGINYYSTMYARNNNAPPSRIPVDFDEDSRVIITGFKDGISIGSPGASTWLHMYPPGLRELLNYIRKKYNNPSVYITENGIDDKTMPPDQSLNDAFRITCISKHLHDLHQAISDGCNVKGYYGWTLLDDFEWNMGYSIRFGLYFIDRDNNSLTRLAKASTLWLKNFLAH